MVCLQNQMKMMMATRSPYIQKKALLTIQLMMTISARVDPVGSESVSGYIVITASRRFQSQVNIIPIQEATRI